MTYLTVSISAADIKGAISQIRAGKKAGAEAIELRMDYLKNLTVELAKNLIGKAVQIGLPIIVTCRDKREGGAADYPLKLRLDVLIAGVEAGADFIDFEYENFLKPENQKKVMSALSKNKKTRLILSAHNFKTKFDNIKKLYSDITTLYHTAIPKIVYTANHINDCFEAFDLLHSAKGDSIVLCMGEAGLASRIIAKKLDGLVTYASLNERNATATGQLTIEQMKKQYSWERIDADTELYGIIGSPVTHSLSPLIHNSCFAEIKANLSTGSTSLTNNTLKTSKLYLPLLVEGRKEQFNQFMENCLERNWLDFRGFSVTIPHKETALKFVKQKKGFIEPLAKRIGAVNTIIIERSQVGSQKLEVRSQKSQVAGYNTDYAGAMDAITAGMGIRREDLKDMPVAVIGAGGGARAIVAGLRDCRAKVKIYNRTVKRAEGLAKEFNCEWASLKELKSLDAKLIINCTSIGMEPDIHSTPLPKELIKKDMVVFDTVYNPAETLLLKQAKEVGAKTISGLDMFINQAAEQLELFIGQSADPKIIRKTLLGNPHK